LLFAISFSIALSKRESGFTFLSALEEGAREVGEGGGWPERC
jgi:hypothetical protein